MNDVNRPSKQSIAEIRLHELAYVAEVLENITKQDGKGARESAWDTLAWLRNRMKAAVEPAERCPHGEILADNVCGPCSQGRPNRRAGEPKAALPGGGMTASDVVVAQFSEMIRAQVSDWMRWKWLARDAVAILEERTVETLVAPAKPSSAWYSGPFGGYDCHTCGSHTDRLDGRQSIEHDCLKCGPSESEDEQ